METIIFPFNDKWCEPSFGNRNSGRRWKQVDSFTNNTAASYLEIETPGGDGNVNEHHFIAVFHAFGNRNSGRRWKPYRQVTAKTFSTDLEIETPGGDGNTLAPSVIECVSRIWK